MVSYADRLFRFQINRLVKVRQLPRDDSRGLKRKASGGSRASAMRSRSRSRYPTSSDPGASSSSKDASRKNFSAAAAAPRRRGALARAAPSQQVRA